MCALSVGSRRQVFLRLTRSERSRWQLLANLDNQQTSLVVTYPSPRPEDIAGQALDDQGTEAVAVLLGGSEDVVDHKVIDGAHVATACVAEHLLNEMPREGFLALIEQDLFEPDKIGEGFAGGELT